MTDFTELVDLGEILIPFGEFVENNAHLPHSSYCAEWWEQDHEAKTGQPAPKGPFTGPQMVAMAETTGVPLHPDGTLLWHDVTLLDIRALGVLFNTNIFPDRAGQYSESWIYGGAADRDVVHLVAPTSTPERMRKIAELVGQYDAIVAGPGMKQGKPCELLARQLLEAGRHLPLQRERQPIDRLVEAGMRLFPFEQPGELVAQRV